MLDVLVIASAVILGIVFFRKKGEKGQGLVIQFPLKNQKGIRNRTNGYIVLVVLFAAIVFTQMRSQNRSLLGFVLIMLGALAVVLFSMRKEHK